MADREKAIKGFECCMTDMNRSDSMPCRSCPYGTLPKKENCQKQMFADVYALLKEQNCNCCGTVFDVAYKAGKADAVVRCKDCKFWYKDECSHLCKITGDLHPANWFCADGERRSE